MRVLACVLFALAWSAVIAMPLVGYFDASEMRRFAPPLLTITALSFALSGGYFAVQANLEDWARKIEMQRTHKASQHP